MVGDDKATLRANLLARRRLLPVAVRESAAARLITPLLAALAGRHARWVAAYVPVGTEPGGAGLPEALRNAGLRVLLPVLQPDLDLDWAEYTGPASVAKTARGLWEPTGTPLGPAALTTMDAMVVPAVAVDMHGVRLGRGGGSYDRVLARLPEEIPSVALLYDDELIAHVPSERHDRTVSAVITPSGGWRWLVPPGRR